MTLIKSISGIRGTIGGVVNDNLTPLDIVKFTAAYAVFIKNKYKEETPKIVLGRDARLSGDMLHRTVTGTLIGMGCEVIDIGMATTPTTEIAVMRENSSGGIILTASHNPKQWNALKLLNRNGEFLSAAEGKKVIEIADDEDFDFVPVDQLGRVVQKDYLQPHINAILSLDAVDVKSIANANFTVAIDCINSVGGIAIPALLKALGVKHIKELNCEPTGYFAHTPEPLPQNLTELSSIIKNNKADVGFAVDPDVDRLAIICEDGSPFGEEYTLVSVADYILSRNPGNTVSNLSSTRALRDITEKKYGQQYYAAAVGEVNVVTKMKEVNAIIGGEGNGGVIYPALHYGRDALVGIALFLTHLAKSGKKVSKLKQDYPIYHIVKQKIDLQPGMNVDNIFSKIKNEFSSEKITDIDGIKIDFADKWVHLRKSNTEPIIRIYSEAHTEKEAEEIGKMLICKIKEFV